MGKSAAYLVQVGGIVSLLMWYVSPAALSSYFRREGRRSFLLTVGVMFTVALSMVVTLALTGQIEFSYVFVFVFTIFIYFYSISNYKKRFIRPRFAFWGLVMIGLIEAAVAVAQQQGSFPIALPGATYGFDNLRVPSLTGSYLHYPLFVGIVASLCGADYLMRKKVSSGIACAVLTVCIFSSLSRSGMLIILATFALAFLREPIRFLSKNAKLIIAGLVACMAIMVLGGARGGASDSVMNVGTERMIGATSLESDGNDGRTEAWDKAAALVLPVNVVAGSYFGLVTNSASDSVKNQFGIVESSLLQQVLNVGLIGTIFYYGLLISVTRLMCHGSALRLCVWAALFQSLFYQSIEVIPFVFLLMTLPVFDMSEESVQTQG
ncbi:hypothetical protein PQR02_11045 [Paraburkholderia sediminicola]|uniref:Uncharacterized protein n=1 Tax=Paraburkholderia rhynchosiae TaxID=487049 RepID=A0ACC7NF09_9BURK